MFNPKRLEFARIRRQWTKARLAKALGVQSRSIQGYESGEYAPDSEKLGKISELLNFPTDFFFGEDLPEISAHAASFRSMSKMSGMLRDSALSAGAIAFKLNDWIEEGFTLPTSDLPDLSDLAPEDAAATLRRIWGLGEAPIGNLIHLMESKGIRIFSLAMDAREVDAYSVWHNSKPFVFLNTFKSAEHSRFDAAHELKHLVCDRHSMLHGGDHTPQMERDAQAFASAFLMPRNGVLASKPGFISTASLIKYKKAWGVSVAALAYRLNQLNCLTEWGYRSLCIDIAKSGYRTTEPDPMRHETSQVLGKVMDCLRKEGTTLRDIARELCVPAEDIEHLTFGLVLNALSRPAGENAKRNGTSERPRLRVV